MRHLLLAFAVALFCLSGCQKPCCDNCCNKDSCCHKCNDYCKCKSEGSCCCLVSCAESCNCPCCNCD